MKRKKMMTKMMRMKKKMMMNRMEHFYIIDKSFIKNDMYKMYAYILNKRIYFSYKVIYLNGM